MIRAISSIIFCAALGGCALDPVSLYLEAQAAMYTPPAVDPLEGITPERIGATPSAYRKFDCQELFSRLGVEKRLMSSISASDSAGRTMQSWHIDAVTTVMHEKQCYSPEFVANPPATVVGAKPGDQKNTTKTPSETIVSEAVQPKDKADPHCFAIFQPVEGESPRALMAAPASTPDANVSYDVVARRYQQFIALAHQAQPGVWHKDIAGPDCNAGEGLLFCTGTAYRHIFGPSHMAMIFCGSSKEESIKGFERLKATLTSPHIVEWPN
jgi:hypothetical protein